MAVVPSAPAVAQSMMELRQDRRGPSMSVREIERRVVPRMQGAQYLGFDYDPARDVYTLKFLRNGSVIWVDVDGRTGQVIRSSGR